MTTDMRARDEAEFESRLRDDHDQRSFEAWFEGACEQCHQEDEPGIEANMLQNKHNFKIAFESGVASERARSAVKLEKAKERRVFQKIKLAIAFEALEKIAVMKNDAAPLATTAMRRIYSVNKMTVTAAESGDEK